MTTLIAGRRAFIGLEKRVKTRELCATQFLFWGFLLWFSGTALPLAVAADPVATTGTDWPQWRGPARNGIAPEGPKLLDAWPTNGPKRVWKNGSIPGWLDGGSGSIVISGGKAFVYVDEARFTPMKFITPEYLAQHGWDPEIPADLVKEVESARTSAKRGNLRKPEAVEAFAKDFLAKLDPEQARRFGPAITARLKAGYDDYSWTTLKKQAASVDKVFHSADEVREVIREQDFPGVHTRLRNERADFLAKAEHLVDMVVCLDAATGKELWHGEYPGVGADLWHQNFRASGTPAIGGGRCYVAGSTGLYCLNVQDGSEVWRRPTRFSNSSPLVAGDGVYVLASPSDKPNCNMGGVLCAYDAASGRLHWQSKVGSDWGSSVVPWFSGGKLYLVASSCGVTVCLDAEKGAVMWEAHAGSASATPVILGDILVVNGSTLFAFKISPEKAELLWKTGGFGSDRQGSPFIYQDHVYVNGNGLGCVDLKTGAIMWRGPGTQLSSPVEADGKIFSFAPGTDEYSYSFAMYKASPEKTELGHFNPGGSCCSSPAIVDGRLYLRLTDGVACYDLRAP
jgi:outer membrane protein assembly factor BamB